MRRMVGDELCQKAFFLVCTWTWIQNVVKKGPPLRSYQYALITGVFQYQNPKTFIREEKRATRIKSLEGRVPGYFSYETLNKLANRNGILGPFGAMLGRDFEQEVMLLNNVNYLPEAILIDR